MKEKKKQIKSVSSELRTCIGCRLIQKKKDLLRLEINSDQEVIIKDRDDLSRGRGAYVCNYTCLRKAIKQNQINRAFRQKVKTNLLENSVLQ